MQLVDRTADHAFSWLWAFASLGLGVIGQLMFRRFGLAQADTDWPFAVEVSLSAEMIPQGLGWLLAGGLCYLIAVLLWVRVLQQLTLARAYPLLSLGYPLVYVGAVYWLAEAATPLRTAGTVLVCVGVLLAVAPEARGAGSGSR